MNKFIFINLMYNKLKIILIVFIFTFISCSTYLYKQNLNLEIKSTTYNQFQKERIHIYKEVDFKLENDFENYKVVESKINHADGSMNYIYAFRNDTLIYFGYPYQFSQNQSETINEIGKYYSLNIYKKPGIFK